MSFSNVISQTREMGPGDVLRYAVRGAPHMSMQDVPLGAIDPDFDLRSDVGIRQAMDAVGDMVNTIADGTTVPPTSVIFTAQPNSRLIWLATERVALMTVDSNDLIRDRTLSVVLAFVADYRGMPLACLRGTNGGAHPSVPPNPVAADGWRLLRLAAGSAALPELAARAGDRLQVVSGTELGNDAESAIGAYLEDNRGRRRRS